MRHCNTLHGLKQPRDYHLVGDEYTRVLYCPNDTESWCFDSAMIRDCKVTLMAFENHSEQLPT